eukprot:TRINITY_DN24332_c0_g1_i1.p1 TRINITY_DN24332_c0_g1~~TRINITY_DN24332_c0_g1_i1.p1  ORF type:complete len:432 (+),score=132.99 TRINITY_DN24332_c0_g1_i1:110-1405(+)
MLRRLREFVGLKQVLSPREEWARVRYEPLQEYEERAAACGRDSAAMLRWVEQRTSAADPLLRASLLDIHHRGAAAVDLSSVGDSPAAALLRYCVRQHEAAAAAVAAAASGGAGPGLAGIATADASDLSLSDFRAAYEGLRQPVVIKGLPTPWASLAELEERYGDCDVRLHRRVWGVDVWAGMAVEGDRASIADVLRGAVDDNLQVFDLPLSYCAPKEELGEVTVPMYFAANALHTSSVQQLRHWWPSLFVCTFAGSGSSLHVDAGATHFWMTVVAGEKRWRLIPPRRVPELKPFYSLGTTPTFGVNTEEAIDACSDYDVVLKAGDTIFVPHGWAHKVDNVGVPCVAVAGNYINSSNFDTALEDASLSDAVLDKPSDVLITLGEAAAAAEAAGVTLTDHLDGIVWGSGKAGHLTVPELAARYDHRRLYGQQR